jgi:Outer membrane protein
MTKIKFVITGLVMMQTALFCQGLSLRQCIDYANANNSNIKIANYTTEIYQKKINEQVGSGLPKVDFNGTLTDNVKITTSLLPGELMGKPGTFIPVQMGTQYNASGSFQLTQKIYDPAFWVGLRGAKIAQTYAEQNFTQTNEQVVYSVSKVYYQTLIIGKQLNVLQATLDASGKMLESLELKYSTGVAKKIDVDKIRVSYNNIKSQVEQTALAYKQSLNNLKYQMGMPVEEKIELADTLLNENFVNTEESSGSKENYAEKRIDFQQQKTNLLIQEADRDRNISTYFPSLNFNASYTVQAMRKEFNLLQSGYDWFRSSSIWLSLSIPIFDGFQKGARVAQSELNVLSAKESIKFAEQAIKVEISNYDIQYRNALDNIKNEKENLTLAEDVYKNTQLEYQQGAGSSLELVQAESSLREAQNNYFNKLLNLYIARIDVEKSKGNLMNFINNLK